MQVIIEIPDPEQFKEDAARVLEKATPKDFLSSEGSVYQDSHRRVSEVVRKINDQTRS